MVLGEPAEIELLRSIKVLVIVRVNQKIVPAKASLLS